MRYYPLLLDIRRAHCLVVGAGEVGQRKIEGLLACDPAGLTAVDPMPPSPEVAAFLARYPNFTYAQRFFADADLDGARLVFACTPWREVNARISLLCRQKNILCNMADDPEKGDFTLPAISVKWWDSIQRKAQTSEVPAISFKAVANPGNAPVFSIARDLKQLGQPSQLRVPESALITGLILLLAGVGAGVTVHIVWISRPKRGQRQEDSAQTDA